MKTLSTLLSILFFALSGYGQTFLSQELGTPRDQVTSFLVAKKGITISSPDENTVSASNADFRVDFLFNDGVLYKSVAVRKFTNKKEASESVKSLRDYYALLKATQVDLAEDSKNERFAAMQGRIIHEVYSTSISKDVVEVTQTKMDLDRCPVPEMKAAMENEKIFAMISQ